jgi:uncharacterized membrane protein YfcA
MDLVHLINPLYPLSGVVVGLMVGLTGVGGGSMMTPLLVLAFHVPPATAVGTDLFYAGATNSVGAATHGAGRTVDWRVVRRLASGSAPAAVLTLLAMVHWHVSMKSPHGLITSVLGIALILTASAILFRPLILKLFESRVGDIPAGRQAVLTVLLGAFLGVLVTISSVGAGAIGFTVLLVLYPRLPAARLVGTDIAHAVPLTLLAGFGHALTGALDVKLLIALLIGSIPGIIIGSLLAGRTPDRLLRPILASTLALAGGRLLF